jgi:hypothetical protein
MACTASWAARQRVEGGETRTPLRPSAPPEVEGCRSSDLRFHRTSGVRSCPLLSAVHPSAADRARTDGVPIPPGVDAPGAPIPCDQGSDRLSWLAYLVVPLCLFRTTNRIEYEKLDD